PALMSFFAPQARLGKRTGAGHPELGGTCGGASGQDLGGGTVMKQFSPIIGVALGIVLAQGTAYAGWWHSSHKAKPAQETVPNPFDSETYYKTYGHPLYDGSDYDANSDPTFVCPTMEWAVPPSAPSGLLLDLPYGPTPGLPAPY